MVDNLYNFCYLYIISLILQSPKVANWLEKALKSVLKDCFLHLWCSKCQYVAAAEGSI